MSLERIHDLNHEADDVLQRDHDFAEAGDLYTTAGFARLGLRPLAPREIDHGMGLLQFLSAGTCYRLGGLHRRAERRCQMGILLATELRERAFDEEPPDNFYDRARRGIWDEFVGDFRVIAGFDDADEAYVRAQETYREAGDPETGYAEQIHIGLMGFVERVEMGLGHDLDRWSDIRTGTPLSEWVEYKREHLAEFLDALVEQGEWVWEEERPE